MSTPIDSPKPDKALWRYGVISPLLHRDANGLTQAQVLKMQAERRYIGPDGEAISLSPETIRKWLYRYRIAGLAGLADKPRSDSGRFAVPDAIYDAMVELRRAHPRWTLTRLLEAMMADGAWDGRSPSRSTLYRLAKSHGLQRGSTRRSTDSFRTFQFDRFGQLWMADFMHGPRVRVGKTRKKVRLHVILDDCSRYVVAGRFDPRESVEVMIADLQRAVAPFGLPERFYTDNGPCYASRHLKVVCARLGIDLLHTRPYRPQGRGKLERFFRTVRDQFLADGPYKTLADINDGFVRWLARYHETRHSVLDGSPLRQRLQSGSACRHLPEVARIEDLFRMERRCRVYKDGTIRLRTRIFEVPGCLPGSRVTVYFLPWDLDAVYYGDNMSRAIPLDPVANAHRFDHPRRGES